ncbi:hypothetical protein J6590_012034 [Homalodisca vitripennis]|nr:hypothetical protein J6590_012034 [Homalodisca vitripennis]
MPKLEMRSPPTRVGANKRETVARGMWNKADGQADLTPGSSPAGVPHLGPRITRDLPRATRQTRAGRGALTRRKPRIPATVLIASPSFIREIMSQGDVRDGVKIPTRYTVYLGTEFWRWRRIPVKSRTFPALCPVPPPKSKKAETKTDPFTSASKIRCRPRVSSDFYGLLYIFSYRNKALQVKSVQFHSIQNRPPQLNSEFNRPLPVSYAEELFCATNYLQDQKPEAAYNLESARAV